jgi:hypothetical protein
MIPAVTAAVTPSSSSPSLLSSDSSSDRAAEDESVALTLSTLLTDGTADVIPDAKESDSNTSAMNEVNSLADDVVVDARDTVAVNDTVHVYVARSERRIRRVRRRLLTVCVMANPLRLASSTPVSDAMNVFMAAVSLAVGAASAVSDRLTSTDTVSAAEGTTLGVWDGADVVGLFVGFLVGAAAGDGFSVGAAAGSFVGVADGAVVGAAVGDPDGMPLGTTDGDVDTLGATVGLDDGSSDGVAVGVAVGSSEGLDEGRNDGRGVGSSVGARDGRSDGCADGAPVGCRLGPGDGGIVGTDEGPRVGSGVGANVGISVGSAEGPSVGSPVGTKVGTGVGGLVYSTIVVDVDTDDEAVAFLLAVMFTPVMFALASTSALVRLPLAAAELMSDLKELVRFAALPLYSVARRRPSSSLDRATTPSRRTSSVKCTSTSVTSPAAFVMFSARTFVI